MPLPYICLLIAKYMVGSADLDEMDILASWLAEDSEHERVFRQFTCSTRWAGLEK